jgi:hypothetical protein
LRRLSQIPTQAFLAKCEGWEDTRSPEEIIAEAAVTDYLAARFPEAQFPAGLARLVHQRTEGNPLFMVNMVEDWVRRGWLAQVDERWTLRAGLAALVVSVPESLRQMLEHQLDRLSPRERSRPVQQQEGWQTKPCEQSGSNDNPVDFQCAAPTVLHSVGRNRTAALVAPATCSKAGATCPVSCYDVAMLQCVS